MNDNPARIWCAASSPLRPPTPCDDVEALVANGGIKLCSWATGPLCRHYMLAIFDAAKVRVRGAGHVSDRSVHWAFGCLVDGECEPLGAWLESMSGAEASVTIVADLAFRGIERIWHVTGGAARPVLAQVSEAFSETSVFSSEDRARTTRVDSARRREPSPAEITAEQAREYLIQAIRRHGSFESEAAVLDFVSGALQQVRHRTDHDGAAKFEIPQGTGLQSVPQGHA